MKFYQRGLNLFLFIVFLGISISPANAQFSILPYADEKANCKQLLDRYELDRTIPTKEAAEADKLESEYSTAVSELEKKSKDYEDALAASTGCFCGTAPPDAGTCKDKCSRVKEAEKSKADADTAQVSALKKRDKAYGDEVKKKTPERDKLLGCAIKTGRISFAMIPYFITYIINFLLALSGLISVLFIVVGGFQYVYGGLSEHKDTAKKTIKHALIGMAVSILAWSIVNVIIGAITG